MAALPSISLPASGGPPVGGRDFSDVVLVLEAMKGQDLPRGSTGPIGFTQLTDATCKKHALPGTPSVAMKQFSHKLKTKCQHQVDTLRQLSYTTREHVATSTLQLTLKRALDTEFRG